MPPSDTQDGITWTAQAQIIVPDEVAGPGAVRFYFWPATARTTLAADPGPTWAKRTKANTFMVGLKEEVHFEMGTGSPWEWRQIIFTAKGMGQLPWVDSYVAYNANTSGYMRSTREMAPVAQAVLTDILFKGAEGVDWVGYMNAPVDRSRFTILRDRTRRITSGNETGQLRKYNDWLPMGKSLLYDDDEQGAEQEAKRWSSLSKAGMGDVFVVDMFRTLVSSDPNDLLIWRPNACLYWHER